MDSLLGKVAEKVLGRDNDDRDDDRNDYGNRGNHTDNGGHGYGGHGGRTQDASHGEYSSRDTPGYTRSAANIPSAQQYAEGGYGGHGGRPGEIRPGTEFRPAQGSNAAADYYTGNYDSAIDEAAKHAPEGEDKSFFASALGMVMGKEKQLEEEDVDEDEYVNSHKKMYDNHQQEQAADSRSIGAAAAMQALKKFTGGNGGGSHGSSGGMGGMGGMGGGAAGGQNAFIGMAMAECVKLFDSKSSQGALAGGANKQDAVSAAAQMAMKLMLKSKLQAATGGGGGGMSSMMGGGGSHGGAGGLLGLASQFLAK
ncbi:hypothetical protein EDC01DRAFT_26860 [Geopyxis carbonaria]|nr:hypothetical protein EDC01DRAFT_26860 [Geopyxis carbonaria]